MNTKRRVTQSFDAKHLNTRNRATFALGELLMVSGTADVTHSTFTRINGIRPHRGVECRYIIESAELDAKTSVSA